MDIGIHKMYKKSHEFVEIFKGLWDNGRGQNYISFFEEMMVISKIFSGYNGDKYTFITME